MGFYPEGVNIFRWGDTVLAEVECKQVHHRIWVTDDMQLFLCLHACVYTLVFFDILSSVIGQCALNEMPFCCIKLKLACTWHKFWYFSVVCMLYTLLLVIQLGYREWCLRNKCAQKCVMGGNPFIETFNTWRNSPEMRAVGFWGICVQ